MSYDIVIRFPDKKIGDEFASQMSDGFGEGFCNFSFHRKKEGTSGKNKEDYEVVFDGDKRVYFVDRIFEQ